MDRLLDPSLPDPEFVALLEQPLQLLYTSTSTQEVSLVSCLLLFSFPAVLPVLSSPFRMRIKLVGWDSAALLWSVLLVAPRSVACCSFSLARGLLNRH